MEALANAQVRYAAVPKAARIAFTPTAGFDVVERLPGNATTEFGAPGAIAKAEARRLTKKEAGRQSALVAASWTVFDRAVEEAPQALRKGPRGGGRDRDAMVEHVAYAPEASSFAITVQGGAIGRVAEDATAYPGRDARFEMSADTEWDDPALDGTHRDWVRRAMAIVEPDAVIGRYCNEIGDAGPEVTRAIYGDAKLRRLTALKRAWDPDNVFRLNHNIAP